MTYSGHMKDINISTLKSHLSSELRAVSNGEVLIVMDRNTPIARISPIEEESMISSLPRYPFRIPEVSFKVAEDAAAYLETDRNRR